MSVRNIFPKYFFIGFMLCVIGACGNRCYADTSNSDSTNTSRSTNNESVQLISFNPNDAVTTFLKKFFGDQPYVVLKDPLITANRKLWVAVHYVNTVKKMFERAIVFEINSDGAVDRLVIDGPRFANSDGTILIDLSEHEEIYGYRMEYSYPKNPGFVPGLYIETFFDKGNRVADGFTIDWNEDKLQFERIHMDFW